ncbi:hypothetical protein M0811_10964 [Anaeramoeba ignava]|uniref:Uncharacterized protein n=1 Tax=Anaeramoeba ignava TaxID=1746090 RepID=A0A9Q0LCS1_ANAIG|nr:hypothetical protein M0811_10964 [Anaeramoeba ignava]
MDFDQEPMKIFFKNFEFQQEIQEIKEMLSIYIFNLIFFTFAIASAVSLKITTFIKTSKSQKIHQTIRISIEYPILSSWLFTSSTSS